MTSSIPIPNQSRSFWIDSTLESNYPTLTEDLSVDVAIVGAGLVGITAAKLLKQAGKNDLNDWLSMPVLNLESMILLIDGRVKI